MYARFCLAVKVEVSTGGNCRCHCEVGSSMEAALDTFIQEGQSLMTSGGKDLAKACQSKEVILGEHSTKKC